MKTFYAKFAAVALGAASVASVQATPIVGEINISGFGGVTLINNVGDPGTASPNNADAVVFPVGTVGGIGNAAVTEATGDFSGSFFSVVDQNDFVFNPETVPVSPLWTIMTGPLVGWTFQLTDITLVNQTIPGDLQIKGLGYFDDNIPGGKDKSLGSWSFVITTTGSSFTWTSAHSAPPKGVPDGGMSLALLGGAFMALGMIRQKSLA